jgi:hypothetical protein
MANRTYAWLLVVGACTHLGGCASRPVAISTAQAAPSSNDVQCRDQSVTGSLLKTRVCLTKAQRDAQQADTDQTKQMMKNPQAGCQKPSGQPCG